VSEPQITIMLAPAPAGEGRTAPCVCDDWLERQTAGLPPRCPRHSRMMRAIGSLYRTTNGGDPLWPVLAAVMDLGDGYGEPGFLAGDWTGIRDASPYSIEQMYDVIVKSGRVACVTPGCSLIEGHDGSSRVEGDDE
jgi:hypothetical protein